MKGSILQFLSKFNCKGYGTNQDESSKLPYGGGKRKVEKEDDLDEALEDVPGPRKSMRMMMNETNLTGKLHLGKLRVGAEPGGDQAEQQQPTSENDVTGNGIIGSLDDLTGLGTPMVDGKEYT